MDVGVLELVFVFEIRKVLESSAGEFLGFFMLLVFRHPPTPEFERRLAADGINEGYIWNYLIAPGVCQEVQDIGVALYIGLGESAYV